MCSTHSFTALMLELESGEVYGACFHLVKERNPKGGKYRTSDCRKHCRELGADLPVPRSAVVQDYIISHISNAIDSFWIGAVYSPETGNWSYLADGSEVVFTSWKRGQPNQRLECGERCVDINAMGEWLDASCGEYRQCICHVENATREGATAVSTKVTPFLHQNEGLVLLLLCIAVVGCIYGAIACGGAANAQVAATVVAQQSSNVSSNVAATIESKEEEEEKEFKMRLDDKVSFLQFRKKDEEELFAKTRCDVGFKDVRATLMRTLPLMMLAASVLELAVIEGWNSIPGLGEGLSPKHFGSRPLVSPCAASSYIVSLCVALNCLAFALRFLLSSPLPYSTPLP